jgi:dTDP-4-amino-4,6-dideoxygalactose transaminase
MSKLAINGGEPVRTEPFPSWPVWDQSEIDAATRVIESGDWSHKNPEIESFEQEFAALQGAKHGIVVNSGTTAIRIGLQALGLKQGDEVIVPAYTFIGSVTPIMDLNAVPVFVDIDPDTYNIDPKAVEGAITARTTGIMPVQFAGLPADMDAIMDIAERHDLWVMEDAAQAWGAQWGGTGVGHIGGAGTFSFQSSKNLTAGEGGIVLTDDDGVAELARSYMNCGRSSDGIWYGHYRVGGNYRMPALCAAVLRAQLARYPEALARREENGTYLAKRLSEIPGNRPLVRHPKVTRHAYHLFIWRYDTQAFDGLPRSVFFDALRAEGIAAYQGYSLPLNEQPVFTDKGFDPAHPAQRVDYAKIEVPEAKRACEEESCWFGQFVLLGTQRDMDDIADAVLKVYENRKELLESTG